MQNQMIKYLIVGYAVRFVGNLFTQAFQFISQQVDSIIYEKGLQNVDISPKINIIENILKSAEKRAISRAFQQLKHFERQIEVQNDYILEIQPEVIDIVLSQVQLDEVCDVLMHQPEENQQREDDQIVKSEHNQDVQIQIEEIKQFNEEQKVQIEEVLPLQAKQKVKKIKIEATVECLNKIAHDKQQLVNLVALMQKEHQKKQAQEKKQTQNKNMRNKKKKASRQPVQRVQIEEHEEQNQLIQPPFEEEQKQIEQQPLVEPQITPLQLEIQQNVEIEEEYKEIEAQPLIETQITPLQSEVTQQNAETEEEQKEIQIQPLVETQNVLLQPQIQEETKEELKVNEQISQDFAQQCVNIEVSSLNDSVQNPIAQLSRQIYKKQANQQRQIMAPPTQQQIEESRKRMENIRAYQLPINTSRNQQIQSSQLTSVYVNQLNFDQFIKLLNSDRELLAQFVNRQSPFDTCLYGSQLRQNFYDILQNKHYSRRQFECDDNQINLYKNVIEKMQIDDSLDPFYKFQHQINNMISGDVVLSRQAYIQYESERSDYGMPQIRNWSDIQLNIITQNYM